MTNHSSAARCMIAAALVLASAVPATARAQEAPRATRETIQALKQGGYVLYMRHAASDTSKPDRAPEVDLKDCATQRPLSDDGRRQAAHIGKAIRALGIPIGEILVSPYCRVKETAELAFGGSYTVRPSLRSTSNMSEAGKGPLLEDLRALLAKPVPHGGNRLLLSHNAPLMDAVGIFPKPEGVVLVFRPNGKGGADRVATITPDEWDRLSDSLR
jgi:phosphohistidine phosphatase SixA